MTRVMAHLLNHVLVLMHGSCAHICHLVQWDVCVATVTFLSKKLVLDVDFVFDLKARNKP